MTGLPTRAETTEIRERLGELRRERKQLQDAVAEARTELADDPSQGNSRRLAQAVNAVEAINSQIGDLEAEQQRMLAGMAAHGVGGSMMPGAGLAQSFGEPQFASEMRQLATSSAPIPHRQLMEISAVDVAAWTGRRLAQGAMPGVVTPSPSMDYASRVVPLPTAPPRFLDVVPSQVLDQPGVVPYAAEVSVEGGPAPVEPEEVKSEIGIEYEDREATPTTIAGHTKVSRIWLSDFDQLEQAVRGRLLDLTRNELERQVLSGDGDVSDRTGRPGLVGLLNTDGVQDVAAGGSDPTDVLDGILRGRVAVEAVGGRPNFCALSLDDWASLMAATTSGSGQYLADPFAFADGAQTVWGMTLVAAAGIEAGAAVVGDSTALTLLISEPAHVLAGTESDDLIRNRVTLLAEVRAALAVWVPAFLCLVSLA